MIWAIRKSRVEDRKLRVGVEGRGSRVEDRGSRVGVEDRGSRAILKVFQPVGLVDVSRERWRQPPLPVVWSESSVER